MNYRYRIHWTQRRAKRQLLPCLVVAANREAAVRMLADAMKENQGILQQLPKRISIVLGSRDQGPSRVEWRKQ